MTIWTDASNSELTELDIKIIQAVVFLQDSQGDVWVSGYSIHGHINVLWDWPTYASVGNVSQSLQKLSQNGYLISRAPESETPTPLFCYYRVDQLTPGQKAVCLWDLVSMGASALGGVLGIIASCYWVALLLGEHPGSTEAQVALTGFKLSGGCLLFLILGRGIRSRIRNRKN